DVAYKALVDLDAVGRQVFQVIQGRLPRAEIVDRQPATDVVQRLQVFQQIGNGFDTDALGDLQLQGIRRQPAFSDGRADHLRQVRLHQLHGREVHTDTQGQAITLVPACGRLARGAQ